MPTGKSIFDGPGPKKKVSGSRDAKKYVDFRAEDSAATPAHKARASAKSNKFYSGASAPRVGGAAQKSTTVYTGKGAVKSAKKVKRTGPTNKRVRSVSAKKY